MGAHVVGGVDLAPHLVEGNVFSRHHNAHHVAFDALRRLHGHLPLVVVLDFAGEGDHPFLAQDRDVAGRPHPAVLELLADFLCNGTVGHGVFLEHDRLLVEWFRTEKAGWKGACRVRLS